MKVSANIKIIFLLIFLSEFSHSYDPVKSYVLFDNEESVNSTIVNIEDQIRELNLKIELIRNLQRKLLIDINNLEMEKNSIEADEEVSTEYKLNPRNRQTDTNINDVIPAGILSKKGKFNVVTNARFVHSSNTRVAIFGYTILPAVTVGSIDVRETVTQSYAISSLFRYGVGEYFELESELSYIYRNSLIKTRPLNQEAEQTEILFEPSGHGIGDLNFGFNYQANNHNGIQGADHYYILSGRVRVPTGTDPFKVERDGESNLELELPTGSGFWALTTGFNLLKPSQPAIFFAGSSYTHQFSRYINDTYGRVDPGEIIGINFGMGFSLSNDSSFSISYKHSRLAKTTFEKLNDNQVTKIEVGLMSINIFQRFSERIKVDLVIDIGVTEEAPDVGINFRLPGIF